MAKNKSGIVSERQTNPEQTAICLVKTDESRAGNPLYLCL